MEDFHAEHPEYSRELLSFVLAWVANEYWPTTYADGESNGVNVCDHNCTRGQTEPCGCTCLIDPFKMADDEVCLYIIFMRYRMPLGSYRIATPRVFVFVCVVLVLGQVVRKLRQCQQHSLSLV